MRKVMAQETNSSPVPILCTTGCGFYGNPRTNGMCSVCYKEHLSRQNSGVSPLSTMGASGVSSSPSSEVSAIQRIEATLNEAVSGMESASASAAVAAAAAAAAALPVTQQMTEMSISCQEEIPEKTEPVLTQPAASPTPSTDGAEEARAPEPPKPKKNRCFSCRKKVGLTGFDCRCGNIFCGLHRYSDKHNCPYDYKAEAAAKIRKENPVVVADKIQRI